MSEDTLTAELPNRKARGRFRTALQVFAAAWCGVFATSAAATLTAPLEGGFGAVAAIASAALALWAIVVAVDLCSRQEKLPRYGFAAGSLVAASLIPAEWRISAVLLSVLPLFLWFRFGSGWRGWRGSRWAMSALVIVGALFLDIEPLCDMPLPESAYLSTSLLVDKPRVRIAVIGEEVPKDWWRDWGYVDFAADGPADVLIAGGGTAAPLLSLIDRYGMLSRGNSYRRGVYRRSIDRLAHEGVLVMPRDEMDLLPPGNWRLAPLPGALDDWVAARRGSAPVTDPEELDKRLQSHYRNEDPLVPAGAVAAVYYAPKVPPVRFEAKPEHRVPFADWQVWFGIGVLGYFCIRVWLCRREKTSTFVAALENALVLTLFTLGAVRPLGEAEFTLGIPPQLLFAGFGIFLLPLRPGKAELALLNHLGGAALLLPGVFPDSAAVLWGCWLAAAVSGAALREKLAAESPRLAAWGSLTGLAAGGGIYALLLVCGAETIAAVLAISLAARAGLYFRHWRG